MCFRFARIFTGALAACTTVGGDLLLEAADIGAGLSLLQLRAEKAAPSADKLAGQQTELIRSLGDDIVEAQAEMQEIGVEQANARVWAGLQAKADDEAQTAAIQQDQALALGLEQAQARVLVKQDALAKVEEAAYVSQKPARSLPWASSSLSTDRALLSLEKDVPVARPCRFTDPVSGISPGVYNKITQGITTVEDCRKLCEAEEDACLAIVFRKGRSTCATLPRTYDAGYKKAHDRAVVSNRFCGAGPEPLPPLALFGAGVEVTSGCGFSTPIRGKSPGSELQKHEGVTTLEDCQTRCADDTHCLAVIHRHGRGLCFTLPRAYDDNYEVSDDDAVVVNKVCAR